MYGVVISILLALLALFLIARGAIFYIHVSIGSTISKETFPFELEGEGKALLVLGDSTGVGVGAEKPEDSIPGRMARALDIGTVENRAVSGALVRDIEAQIRSAKQKEYDYIVILVGGNDIIRFHDASTTAALLKKELAALPKGKQVLIVCAANVGGAMIFPLPLRWYYEKINLRYHARLAEVAKSYGFTYVNLYRPQNEDVFVQEPERYTAKDRLHPSSEGYRVWWERIQQSL